MNDGKYGKIIFVLDVDDLIIAGDNDELIQKIKHNMSNEFEMKDLGELKYFLVLIDRSKSIRFLACAANPANVELVSQHSPSISTPSSSCSSGSSLRLILASRLICTP